MKCIRKRGNSVTIALDRDLMEQLGWNLNDAVKLDVVDGSMVVTKVTLPRTPTVSRVVQQSSVDEDVQLASDNGTAEKRSE